MLSSGHINGLKNTGHFPRPEPGLNRAHDLLTPSNLLTSLKVHGPV